jgi:hypothetical protein
MELTEQHLEVVFCAWVASRDGNGVVVAAEAHPAADALAEQGWLERRSEPNGDVSWWWTPAAEGALDMSALMSGYAGSVN